MQRFSRTVLLALLMLPGLLHAAEADEQTPDEAAAPADTAGTDADEAAAAEDSDTDATEGVIEDDSFVPSVQISEDLSVSFPTDI